MAQRNVGRNGHTLALTTVSTASTAGTANHLAQHGLGEWQLATGSLQPQQGNEGHPRTPNDAPHPTVPKFMPQMLFLLIILFTYGSNE